MTLEIKPRPNHRLYLQVLRRMTPEQRLGHLLKRFRRLTDVHRFGGNTSRTIAPRSSLRIRIANFAATSKSLVLSDA